MRDKDNDKVTTGHFIPLNMSGRRICFVCVSGRCIQMHGVSWLRVLYKVCHCRICISWPLNMLGFMCIAPSRRLFLFALNSNISNLARSSWNLLPKHISGVICTLACCEERVIYVHNSSEQIATAVRIYDRSLCSEVSLYDNEIYSDVQQKCILWVCYLYNVQ